MFNFRVADLLEQLRKEGVQVDDKVEEYEFGKFGWVMDPEGNRVELWDRRRVARGAVPVPFQHLRC